MALNLNFYAVQLYFKITQMLKCSSGYKFASYLDTLRGDTVGLLTHIYPYKTLIEWPSAFTRRTAYFTCGLNLMSDLVIFKHKKGVTGVLSYMTLNVLI